MSTKWKDPSGGPSQGAEKGTDSTGLRKAQKKELTPDSRLYFRK